MIHSRLRFAQLTPIVRASTGLLFRDQFNRADGPIGSNYTIDDANSWTVTGGKMQQITPGGSASSMRVTAIGQRLDWHVQCLVTKSVAQNYFTVQLRKYIPNGVGNFSTSRWHQFDNSSFTDGTDPNKARLYRIRDGAITRMTAGVNLVNTQGQAYRYNASRIGNELKFYIDGVIQIDTTDALNAEAGYLGMDASGQGGSGTITVQDLIVTSARLITINGLPTGYKIRVGTLVSSMAMSGTATTLDLAGTQLPAAKVEILDPVNMVVATIIPSDGVWGGDVYTYTDYTSRNGYDDTFDFGSSLDTTGVRYSGATPWSKLNTQTTGSDTVSGGYLTMNTPVSGAMNPMFYYQTGDSPASDGSWKTYINPAINANNYAAQGILLRESSTGKCLFFCYGYDNGAKLQVRKMPTGFGSWSANYIATAVSDWVGWLEVVRDGTNLLFLTSEDNSTWIEVLRVAVTTDFTVGPDQIGPASASANGVAFAAPFAEWRKNHRALAYSFPIPSPGAENGVLGWTNVTNVIGSRTGVAHTGSLGFDIVNSGAFEVYMKLNPIGWTNTQLDSGFTVTLKGWGFTWTGATSSQRIRLDCLDGLGASLGQVFTSNWGPAASPTQKTCQMTVPAGTRSFKITFEGTCTAASDCWLDDLELIFS